MNARYLLGLALVTAGVVAACGGSPDQGSLNPGGDNGTGTVPNAPSQGTKNPDGTVTPNPTPAPNPGGPAVPGNLPTNSKAGKAFFAASVQPILESKCATCHTAGGPGNPTYIVKGDASKTYDMVYLNGFAVTGSRIVVKGLHSGGSAPALLAAEISTFNQWLALEVKDGGTKTQTNVLEKFGTCFDKTKFDAIGFGALRTTRRQANNNPLAQTENANNCTGCDNKPCSTCHSADDVTGFVMAIGNPNVPGGAGSQYTFDQTKLLSPAFIREYVSTTPAGDPQFNPGVQAKSTNTITKGLAYSHPMFILTPTMATAIQAFVDDAIAKQKAGTCGK